MGHDHAHHRRTRTPGQLRSRDWTASDCQSKWCESVGGHQRWIGQALNLASAPPGRSSAAIRRCSAAVTAIFHDSAWSQGAQGLWQNPPFLGESDAFASAGCAFATSYCATTLGQTPSAISLSSGFQAITTPPTAGQLYRLVLYPADGLQARQGAAIQRERRARSCSATLYSPPAMPVPTARTSW